MQANRTGLKDHLRDLWASLRVSMGKDHLEKCLDPYPINFRPADRPPASVLPFREGFLRLACVRMVTSIIATYMGQTYDDACRSKVSAAMRPRPTNVDGGL